MLFCPECANFRHTFIYKTPLAYTIVTRAGTDIRRDAEGRYCLNDCHKAAGESPAKRPNYWANNAQTKDLIAELTSAGNPALPLQSTAGGSAPGTYAVKELVYASAMWISPSFHLQVIRAFDGLVTGVIPAPAHPQGRLKGQSDQPTARRRRLFCVH